jgi:hypothetical protein
VKGSRTHDGAIGTRHGDVLRAGADGRTFTHCRSDGSRASVIAVTDTGYHEAVLPPQVAAAGTLPGGDGQAVYAPGAIAGRSGALAAVAGGARTYLPAAHGPLFLSLPGRDDPRKSVAVHAGRGREPLFEVPPIPAAEAVLAGEGAQHPDRHLFFVPAARVLVVLSPDGATVTLHRFDVVGHLEKAADYLFVASAPPQAVAGKSFNYQLSLRSKKPAGGFRLLSGPPGLAVGAEGRVSWGVPADFGKAAAVAVAITDAAGKEQRHEFELIPTLPPPE